VTDDTPIETSRLHLVLVEPAALEMILAHDVPSASAVQGFVFAEDFLQSINDVFLTRHLEGRRKRESDPGWFVRAIIRKEDGEVLGHCGFHGDPRDVGRAEIGYTVFSPFRRQGYAVEAVRGLVAWARSRGCAVVVAAVAPRNVASLGVVKKLGFEQTGVQGHGTDHEEDVFELHL
jgi:RimJ/RimL family protein N-acetyltransferase